MVGANDAICVDRRAVGVGNTPRLCGAKTTILKNSQENVHNRFLRHRGLSLMGVVSGNGLVHLLS